MGTHLPPPPKNRAQPPIFGPCPNCGHTAGWIKMALGMEVGIGQGNILVDGDPASPSQKRGHNPFSIFGLYVLWSNGWIKQDANWYEGRPRPRPHCVTLGPSPPKGDTPHFSVHVYCGQTVAHLSYCWALVLSAYSYWNSNFHYWNLPFRRLVQA